MASKFVIFATLLVACNAYPVWYNEVNPGPYARIGRAPTISYGYGSGFASNIGGISHSSGFGTSFSSDGSQASGSGMGIVDGNYARGVGIASAGNTYPVYRIQPTYIVPRPTYGNAIATAQNFGGYNTATSLANTGNSRAISSAQNIRGYENAFSAVNNGYRSAASSATSNGFGKQNAISSVYSGGPGYNTQAISASEQDGAYKGSTAHTVQQRGNAVQHSGASSIAGPGIRAAHSHAVETGYY